MILKRAKVLASRARVTESRLYAEMSACFVTIDRIIPTIIALALKTRERFTDAIADDTTARHAVVDGRSARADRQPCTLAVQEGGPDIAEVKERCRAIWLDREHESLQYAIQVLPPHATRLFSSEPVTSI